MSWLANLHSGPVSLPSRPTLLHLVQLEAIATTLHCRRIAPATSTIPRPPSVAALLRACVRLIHHVCRVRNDGQQRRHCCKVWASRMLTPTTIKTIWTTTIFPPRTMRQDGSSPAETVGKGDHDDATEMNRRASVVQTLARSYSRASGAAGDNPFHGRTRLPHKPELAQLLRSRVGKGHRRACLAGGLRVPHGWRLLPESQRFLVSAPLRTTKRMSPTSGFPQPAAFATSSPTISSASIFFATLTASFAAAKCLSCLARPVPDVRPC